MIFGITRGILLNGVLLICLSAAGCDSANMTANQRTAKRVLFLKEVDGNTMSLREFLEGYASSRNYRFSDGTSCYDDWGCVVNMTIEPDEKTRIWIGNGVKDKRIFVYLYSDLTEAGWISGFQELSSGLESQFGAISISLKELEDMKNQLD